MSSYKLSDRLGDRLVRPEDPRNGGVHENRRVSISSTPPRRSGTDIRRKSLSNSLGVPKPSRNGSNSNGNGDRRRWSKKYNEGFEFDPLISPTNRSSSSSLKSGSTTANDQESKESLLASKNAEEEKEKIKEVGQIASVFLEVRKSIMNEYNIDLAHNEHLDVERDKNIPGQIKLKNISRATLQRAEKVKVMLNLYYYYVLNSQRVTAPKFSGVDGVFNPLQVIRNRRIRKKYHQPPKLAIKTLPYASTVFSRSKNKLIWQVDLTELTYDYNWRAQHWHELVNPHGELWFPTEESFHHHHHHHHHRPHLPHHHSSEKSISNIHDKLFELADDDSEEPDPEQQQQQHGSSNESSKDDLLEVRSRKRDKLASKIRRRSKSPNKKRHGGSKDHLSEGIEFDKERISADTSATNLVAIEGNNETYKGNLLNEINIEPIKVNQRATSSASENNGGTGNSTIDSIKSPDNDLDVEELRNLNAYLNNLRKLDDLMNFGEHHLAVKEREYCALIKFDKVMNKSTKIKNDANLLKTSILKNYERLVLDKSQHLEHYQNELTNNYSPRVEKLLLLSDRTIGEVNTTLSLEVRKLSERAEKLGPAFKRTGSLISLSYWLLENLIVLLLWTIWIGFSIGRIIRFPFLVVWKILKWIFY